MNLAQQAWETNRVERVLQLLEQDRPKTKEADLRGFEWHYLNRLCHQELLTLPAGITGFGHKVLAFSPDGKRLAAGVLVERDPAIKVWDVHTGKGLFVLKGHNHTVASVAFTQDGNHLLSWCMYYGTGSGKAGVRSAEAEVKVWDAQMGTELRTLKITNGDRQLISDVAFSPDGSRLALGSITSAKEAN